MKALKDISGAIRRVEEVSGAIATAIEEQNAVTNEISMAITTASDGTRSSAQETSQAAAAIETTAARAGEVRSAAATLGEARGRLQGTIDAFLAAVAKDVEDRREKLRLDVQEAVLVDSRGREQVAVASNISLTGVFIEGMQHLERDAHVRVRFNDGSGGLARVARRTPDGVGLVFERPLAELPGALRGAA